MDFPHQPDQLTPAWLTDTLRQAGVLHKARVVSFERKPIAETAGLLGQNTIIRLTYHEPEASAPLSLFAKFALADAGQRAHWRTSYVQEVLFYQQNDGSGLARYVNWASCNGYFALFRDEFFGSRSPQA